MISKIFIWPLIVGAIVSFVIWVTEQQQQQQQQQLLASKILRGFFMASVITFFISYFILDCSNGSSEVLKNCHKGTPNF